MRHGADTPLAMPADETGPEDDLPGLAAGRRTVMGALAAGVGLGAVGGAAAQDDDDDDGEGEGDGGQAGEMVLSAALAASEHGIFSEAHGAFHAREVGDGTWAYLLHVEDMDCVTQAHIHEGGNCESGPVVVPLALFTETPAGDSEGALENVRHAGRDSPIAVTGTIEAGGEEGPSAETLQAIADDPSGYYVNVHSTRHPGGEIRGQLRGVEVPTMPTPGVPGDGMGNGTEGNQTVGNDTMGNQTVGNDTAGNQTG